MWEIGGSTPGWEKFKLKKLLWTTVNWLKFSIRKKISFTTVKKKGHQSDEYYYLLNRKRTDSLFATCCHNGVLRNNNCIQNEFCLRI